MDAATLLKAVSSLPAKSGAQPSASALHNWAAGMPQSPAVYAVKPTVFPPNHPALNAATAGIMADKLLNFGGVPQCSAGGILQQFGDRSGKRPERSRSHRRSRREYASDSDESFEGETLHATLPYRGPTQENLRSWKPNNHFFWDNYDYKAYLLYNTSQVLHDHVMHEAQRGSNYWSCYLKIEVHGKRTDSSDLCST